MPAEQLRPEAGATHGRRDPDRKQVAGPLARRAGAQDEPHHDVAGDGCRDRRAGPGVGKRGGNQVVRGCGVGGCDDPRREAKTSPGFGVDPIDDPGGSGDRIPGGAATRRARCRRPPAPIDPGAKEGRHQGLLDIRGCLP
jgi:hypothetical protein